MKILIIDPCHKALESGLEEAGHELMDATTLSAKEIASMHADAEGMLVRARMAFTQEFLEAFPDLVFIARFGSGMEHIDMKWAEGRDIHCLSAAEGNRQAVGEYALGALLSLFRKIPQADQQVRKGIWQREANRGEELSGKTVGIIGHGRMGSAFSQLLRGFDLRVLVYDKYKSGFGHEWIEEVPLEQVQKRSDVLSIHLPLNEETRHYIDRDFIEKLEQRPYLINTSRGDQLVLEDLLWGLQAEKLRGACLDVLEVESKDFEDLHQQKENKSVLDALIDRRDVVLSPHIAGWTHQSKQKMADVLLKKIAALA